MSQTIDTKVVEMQFDNRQFERNVETSLSTLDKLKASLKFDSASDGLERMSKSMKKLDFNPATTSIVVLQEKFSALERVAIGVLENIGAKISNVLIKGIESVTLDPITAGWKKYADKTQAIQTIMAATADEFTDTGEQMEFVNGQLEKLNWFTDETSYSFLDMVGNIGKFTSNKIPLADSVTAMQGISTWAAISGANVQEASRAMYNLSQAMSTGSVKLIDWKSIENANMATAGFKQTVIDTAVELGTLKKVGEGAYKTLNGKDVSVRNFNEQLQQGWFTAEVLMKTLDQYGGFTNALYEATEKTGLSASEMLSAIDDYTSGKKSISQISKELEVDAKTLGPILEDLGSDTYELGRKSFAAAQEAKTFQEAIDSVVEAVGSKWMNIFEILFGNYLEAKELWTTLANELYDIFVEPLNGLEGLLREALRAPQVLEGALDMHDIRYLMGLDDKEISAFEGLFVKLARDHGIAIDTMIRQDGSFRATLKRGWLTNDLFNDMLNLVTDGQVQSMDKIHEAAMAVIRGDYGNDMASRMNALTAAGYDAEAVQNYVNVLYKLTGGTWELSDAIFEAADAEAGLTTSIAEMSDEELASLGLTQDEIELLRKLQEESKNADSKIGMFVSNMYGRPGGELLLEAFGNILGNIPTLINTVSEAWKEVFPPITARQLYDAIVKFHEFSKSLVLSEETTGKLKTVLMGLFSVLKIVKNAIGAVAKTVIPPLMRGLSFVGSKALDIFEDLGSKIKSFSDLVESVGFGKAIDEVAPRLSKFGNIVKTKFRGGLIGVVKSLTGFYDIPENLRSGAEAMYESMPTLKLMSVAFDGLKSKAVSFATSLKEGIKNSKFGQALANSFEKANSAIADGVNPIKAYVGSLRQNFPTFDKFIHLLGDIKKVAGKAKDVLANTFKDLKERFSNFITGFKSGENPIASWFEKLKNNPAIKTVGTALETAFNAIKNAVFNLFDSIKELGPDASLLDIFGVIFEKLKNGAKDLFEKAKNEISSGNLLNKIKGVVGGIFNAISGFAKDHNLPEIFSNAVTAIKNFIFGIRDNLADGGSNIGTWLNNIKDKFASFVDSVKSFFNFDIDKVQSAIAIILGVLGSVLLVKALKNITRIVTNITDILSADAEAKKAAAKAQKLHAWTGLVVGIAVSIGIVAAAIYALTTVDQDKLGIAVGVVALIAVTIVAVIAALGAIQKGLGNGGAILRDIGIGFLAITAGLLILYFALKKLNTLKIEDMNPIVFQLLGVLAGVFLLSAFMRSRGHSGDIKAAIANSMPIIAFAAALFLVVVALSKMSKLIKADDSSMETAMIYLVAILVGLLLAMKALTKMSESKDAKNSALAILSVVASLWLLISSIKKLAKLKIETIAEAIPRFVAIFIMVLALFLATRAAGENASKAGVSLILISVALNLMVLAVWVLGNIDIEKATVGVFALVAMMGGLALLLFAVGAAGKDAIKAGVAILLITGAIVALAYTVLLLSAVSPEQLAIAATVIVGIMAALTVMSLLMAVLFSVISNSKGFQLSAILALGSIVIAIGAVALAVYFLGKSDIDPERMLTVALVLGGLVAVITVCAVIGSLVKGVNVSFLLSMGGIVLAIVAICAAIILLEKYDLSSMTGKLIVVGIVLGALIAATFVLSNIPFNPLMVLQNIVSMGLVVAAVAGLFAGILFGLSALANNETVKTAIDNAGTTLEALGTMFGKFSGGFISGEAEALAGSGKDLSTFATDASAFFDLAGDETKSKGFGFVTALSDAILKLSESSFLDALTALFPGGNGSPLSKISELATELKNYVDIIGEADFDEQDIAASEELAKVLASLYANELPKEGGLISFIKGDPISLDTFGEQLVPLAKGLSGYAEEIIECDFDQEKIDASTKLASALASLYANEMPTEGGLVGFIRGDHVTLSELGLQMIPLAIGLSAYADTVNSCNFDQEKIDASTGLISALAALYDGKMPNEGGLVGFIRGDHVTLGELGLQMVPLALGLAAYADTVNSCNFDQEKIDVSTGLADTLASIYAGTVPTEGGLVGFIRGEHVTLDELGSQLVPLALGLAAYAFIIGLCNFDEEKIKASEDLAGFLGSLYGNELPNTGGVLGFLQGNPVGLDTFGGQLVQLATGLKGYAAEINSATFNKDKIKASKNLANLLVSLNNKLPDATLIDWLTGEDKKLQKFADQLPTLASKLVEYADEVKGIDQSSVEASVKAATMLSDLSAALKDQNLGGWFTDSDLALFGQGLVDLGYYLKEFSKTYEDSVDNNGLTDAELERLVSLTNAIKVLVSLAKNMDKIAEFSSNVSMMQTFLDSIGGLDWSKITAVDPITIQEVTDKIKEMLGVITQEDISAAADSWNGATSMFVTAGNNIADGLIQGINDREEDIRAAGSTIVSWVEDGTKEKGEIASPSQLMHRYGGYLIAGLINGINAGNKEVTKSGEEIVDAVTEGLTNGNVAEKFKGFASDLSDHLSAAKDIFKTAGEESAENYSDGMSTISETTSDTVKDILSSVIKKTRDIGKATTTFATSALKGLKSKIGTITGDGLMGAMPNALSDAQDWISDHKSKIQNATKEYSESTLEGIKTNIGTVTSGQGIAGAVPDALRNVRSWVSNNLGIFRSSGNAITNNYRSGMAANSNAIRNDFPNWVRSAKSAAGSVSTYSTGQYFTQGFINGAGSLRSRLNELARSLAGGAIESLKQRLAERSPSKETFKIGAFFTEGFENGIVSRARLVKVVTSDMAETALDGMATSMGLISDIITNGMDGDPVIRPVLDLSEIQNGVGAINGMMAFNTPYSVMANVNGINASMTASRQRRMSESDVVDAINKLGDNMPTTGDTYNVNGVTYDDGTNIATAVRSLIRAANVNRRS